jgi:hypothetical protein
VGFFYSYALAKALIEKRTGVPMGVLTNLAVGWLSNFLHMPLSMPCDTLVIRMSTTGKGLKQVCRCPYASTRPYSDTCPRSRGRWWGRPRASRCATSTAAWPGLGRIVALYHRAPALYRIQEENRCLYC